MAQASVPMSALDSSEKCPDLCRLWRPSCMGMIRSRGQINLREPIGLLCLLTSQGCKYLPDCRTESSPGQSLLWWVASKACGLVEAPRLLQKGLQRRAQKVSCLCSCTATCCSTRSCSWSRHPVSLSFRGTDTSHQAPKESNGHEHTVERLICKEYYTVRHHDLFHSCRLWCWLRCREMESTSQTLGAFLMSSGMQLWAKSASGRQSRSHEKGWAVSSDFNCSEAGSWTWSFWQGRPGLLWIVRLRLTGYDYCRR